MSEWDAFPAAKPAASAASEWDAFPVAAGPKPSGDDVSAISAAESLPIIGAYAPKAAGYLRHLTRGGTTAENQAQIESDIAAYRQQHPIESAVGGGVIGSIPYAVAGEFAPAAKALGMTGRLLPAALTGGATGAAIGAADAAARGEDIKSGAIQGGLTAAGGIAGTKALGMAYDAARGMFFPQAPVQRFMMVNGRQVPVSETQWRVSQGLPIDKSVARQEDIFRKRGGETGEIAQNLDAPQTQAMHDAHADLEAHLSGQAPGTPRYAGATPFSQQAGGAAMGDLVSQEQARAQAEVARMAGIAPQTEQLRTGFAPGAAAPPASALDAADTIGQGIRARQATARQATRNAYDTAAQVQAGYNPVYMRNVGDTLLDMVNARPDVVRIDPDNTPAAFRAVQSVDRNIQAQLLNAARRGERLGPMEMEQIRKSLGIQQQNAVAAARASNNYEDVRAIGRVRDAFDDWEQQLAQTPGRTVTGPDGQPLNLPGGLLHGDPAEIFATRQAARAAHAQERQTFGRQGPGDAVGTFMGKVLGRFPGQELSPEGIVKQLMGTPDRTFSENAGPILTHLRDNVFGANSPEWAQLKQGLIDHLTGTPPGGEPIPLEKQIQRIDRFLANDRQSNAILNATDRANLTAHANNMRAALPAAPPAADTPAGRVAALAGRDGQAATGSKLFKAVTGAGGEELVPELQRQLSTDNYNQLRMAVWRHFSEAPEGKIAWGPQQSRQKIAAFLNTPLAQTMFDATDRAMMQAVARAHEVLTPIPGTVNLSGSAYTGEQMLKGLQSQVASRIAGGIGLVLGHIPGLIAGEALGAVGTKALEKVGARVAREKASALFLGPRGRYAPVTAPQRVGATFGRLLAPPSGRTGQVEQQSGAQ